MRNKVALKVILILAFSLVPTFIIGVIFISVFTINKNVIQESDEVLSQLQSNIERLKGIQTQFGVFTDFIRFNYEPGRVAVLKFSTDNEYVNNALIDSMGRADVGKCIPKPTSSLPLENLEEQVNLTKQSLSEECFKKVLGVTDKFIKTNFENLSGPTFRIYPDDVSRGIIYLFSFAFWNALLLLILSVSKNFLDVARALSRGRNN